jgi:hypothetical protein
LSNTKALLRGLLYLKRQLLPAGAFFDHEKVGSVFNEVSAKMQAQLT